jgi:signal transduction histidine kinase
MAGLCGYAALHHGLAFLRGRVTRTHILFVLMTVTIMCYTLARAGGYSAQTVDELVAMRRWEVSFLCLFAITFVWFVVNYTKARTYQFVIGHNLLWVFLFVVNLVLPYGIQIANLPDLTYFQLPWGEHVTDLRVLQPSIWHKLGAVGLLITFIYGLHRCFVLYKTEESRRCIALAVAISVLLLGVLFNISVNSGVIHFVHITDFVFVSMILFMDMEMMLEYRGQNRRMADVLNHLPWAISLKDSEGRYLLINRKFQKIFNLSAIAAFGKKDSELFPADLAAVFNKTEIDAIMNRIVVNSDYVLANINKKHFMKLRQIPLQRGDGMVFGVCSIHFNTTAEKNRNEMLHKLRLQVWRTERVASTSAIASSLAHEICQPLSAILNNAQAGLRFLAQEQIDLNEIRELLADIVRDDKRAGNVISGLRTMLQKQEMPLEVIDLSACINEVMELLHAEFIRQNTEVIPMLEEHIMVWANKVQIQQVILNLVINALEAMNTQDSTRNVLHVQSMIMEGNAQVLIHDTGIGIPEDKLEAIFESFYTTKPHGMGVGLEICRGIIEAHSGKIWVESHHGNGATFYFKLPLSEYQA